MLVLLAGVPGLQAQVRPPLAVARPAMSVCRPVAKASLPIAAFRDGRFTVVVEVDDTPVTMLIDTGAAHTLLSPHLADALGLREGRRRVLLQGIGGLVQAGHYRVARSVRFGPVELHDYPLETSEIVGAGLAADPAAPRGLLGTDLLARYDVELDFPGRVMTLYDPVDCKGQLAPWSGRYQGFSLPPAAEHRLVIPVILNGHPLRALIDTGSNHTAASFEAALKAGVDIRALNEAPAGSSFGAGSATVTSHRYRFDSLAVGMARFRNAPVSVEDTELPDLDMLLGMDFLRWRRLWISYATSQIFMQFIPHAPSAGAMPAAEPVHANAAAAPGPALKLWPILPTNASGQGGAGR